jgi:hypothetical protein
MDHVENIWAISKVDDAAGSSSVEDTINEVQSESYDRDTMALTSDLHYWRCCQL